MNIRQIIANALYSLVPIIVGVGIVAVILYAGTSVLRVLIPTHTPTVAQRAGPTMLSLTLPSLKIPETIVFNQNTVKNSLPRHVIIPISATAYTVIDLQTGKIITSKNDTLSLPIASVTKLVTAVAAQRLIDPKEYITITPWSLQTEGDTAHFKKNEKIRAGDLLYPMLMVSSNDAAEAFATHFGRDRFITEMNRIARDYGAISTNFDDASGLSSNNTSTAFDLARIVRGIYLEHPDIFAITLTRSKIINRHNWVNRTHYLNMSSYLGGKNGYTDDADRTAASLFMTTNPRGVTHPIAIIVLKSDNRDHDVLTLLDYVNAGSI